MATIQVRYFAAAADAAGVTAETLTVAEAATVADLRDAMIAEHPGLAGVIQLCSFLVDGQAAEPADPIGATVDVLPPFAGG
ncbi:MULTISPECIES: MoaD/ThiS family protein [unclassified Pseudactinotalea]|uniref:MoaD/ThiS family protein n=1 Tax=unclassified Pseudactinotalea TaxID=2649176 RepID=UPI00128B4395|nr:MULTISPECIES: MoaD/ThiS family protein [unclassified Pseudactinotalea]MPV48490.1 MoaD/ThiS family protein [Pseudactinotalea sp. HY160]QGH68472.1 MoaD/ThiS family protein [Pseudactinotalea sp. HY158]